MNFDTYDTYHLIFVIGAILAGLMLALAAVLFFVLKIPRVVGDLTGSTARKAIEDIRNQNTATGPRVHKSSAVNRERGKVTDKITGSGKLKSKKDEGGTTAMGTQKLSTRKLAEEARAAAEETAVLSPPGAETVVLPTPGNETMVLPAYGSPNLAPPAVASETTVLNANWMAPPPQPVLTDASAFMIEYELTYIHSDEWIA